MAIFIEHGRLPPDLPPHRVVRFRANRRRYTARGWYERDAQGLLSLNVVVVRDCTGLVEMDSVLPSGSFPLAETPGGAG